jgi:hypothetical protein
MSLLLSAGREGTVIEATDLPAKNGDTESGLDNFGAGYFTSSLGRFMTPGAPGFLSLTRSLTTLKGAPFFLRSELLLFSLRRKGGIR